MSRHYAGRHDSNMFRHTAERTKAVNVVPKVSRGGIRL